MTKQDITAEKKALRQRVLKTRDRDHNQFIDKNIAHRLVLTEAWQSAGSLFISVSFGSEVDTHALINNALAAGKTVAVPLCEKNHVMTARVIHDFRADLAPGTMGILEPDAKKSAMLSPETIDLVIVPGVAFSKDGRRLGYGGGYYDRFLEKISPKTPKIALIPEALILPNIPTDSHDLPVDMLISERGIYDCDAQSAT